MTERNSKLTRSPQADSTDVPPSSLCPPRKVVGCMGGNRNVEGCWGFPYLKIKRVSWFLFYGFLVSKRFYVFKIYSLPITKSPFHAF